MRELAVCVKEGREGGERERFESSYVAVSPSSCSSLEEPQTRHLQHTIQGAANNSKGDATSRSRPKPAKIPITCVRCHITDARE